MLESAKATLKEVLENDEVPERKRYYISASRSMFFSGDFDTTEEVMQKATELIAEGYGSVSIRDTHNDDADLW